MYRRLAGLRLLLKDFANRAQSMNRSKNGSKPIH